MTATALPVLTRARVHVVLSLGARALEAAAKFGLYALAARALGGHDAGRFFLALSVVHIVSTVARLGLERPLTRHVAAELAVGDGAAAARAILTGSAAIGMASAAAGALLFLAAPIVAQDLLRQPDMIGVLRLAALIIPLQNLAYALAYALIGLERGAAGQMVMNALAPALSLTALMLGAGDLTRLLIAYATAFGVCVLLGLACVLRERRRLTTPPDWAPPLQPLPSLWHGARPLLVVEVSQASLLSLPVLILGALADPVSVSVFSLASRLSMLVTTVVLSLGALSAPAFARCYRLADWPSLKAAVRHNRRLTLGFCLPLIAAMAIGAAPVLALLDVEATRGVPVLLILLCGQLVFCVLPSRDVLLAMAGEGRILRRLSLWQLVSCTVLCFAAIPVWGAVGAALASATIWIGGALALAVTARRRLPQV